MATGTWIDPESVPFNKEARIDIRGFINYLKNYEKRKPTNREPDNLSSYEKFFIDGCSSTQQVDFLQNHHH